jgi:hypothetical protein
MTDIVSECTDLYQKPSIWTEELIAKISLLWQTNSASEIASILWKQDRVAFTRNAVVGKLHRLKLTVKDKRIVDVRTRTRLLSVNKPVASPTNKPIASPRPRASVSLPPINAARNRIAPAITCIAPRPFLVASHADASPQHIAFADLTSLTCKWPFGSGNPTDFTYCGDHPVKDMPYCLAHCRISYVPPGRRTGRGIAA